jgi:hypothetical protein
MTGTGSSTTIIRGKRTSMTEKVLRISSSFYRCAGPNCGVLKGVSDRWWIMWSSFGDYEMPVMHLAPWDEKLAVQEGAMHVCGEGCAQKLQSQFMGNVLENQLRKSKG